MFSRRRTISRKWRHRLTVVALLGGSAVVLIVDHQSATAAVSPGATERVSVTSDGRQGTSTNTGFSRNGSSEPSISADGRYVAFTSYDQLDPVDEHRDNDTSDNRDVYVRDTVTHHTTLLSHSRTKASEPADRSSFMPSISGDGRFVAFITNATNIVTGSSPMDVYLVIIDRDPKGTGTFDTGDDFAYTQIDEVDDRGNELGNPSLSADASRVAYEAITPGDDSPDTFDVRVSLLRHGDHGQLLTPADGDITGPSLPGELSGSSGDGYFEDRASAPALSADGSHVVLIAEYLKRLDGGGFLPPIEALFDFDVTSKAVTRVDLDDNGNPISTGAGADFVSQPAISGNGRLVAFTVSAGRDLLSTVRIVDRDPNGDGVFGPVAGPPPAGQPISSTIAGRNTAGAVVSAQDPAFSADGRYFAFVTDAGGVHNGVDRVGGRFSCIHVDNESPTPDNASNCDVVVRDLIVDRQRVAAGLPRLPAELASPSNLPCAGFPAGTTCEGGGDSITPVLDADGSAVAYTSDAPDLVDGDTNNLPDAFERHFQPRLAGTPLDFGGLHLADALTLAVPVSHVGFGPLNVTTATVTGTNPTDFTPVVPDTCTNALLHETDRCLVSVRFKPGALGTRTATLEVRWRGSDTNVARIPLSGTGTITPVPGFSVNPDPINFGERPVTASSPPVAVTVTNTGTAPLTITTVDIFIGGGFPGDFRISAQTCTGKPIAPQGTCQVTVIHRPLDTGARPAALQFLDDSPPAGPHLIPMTGAGTIAKLLASPPLSQPRRVSQISGTAFPPGQTVHLNLDNMPGTTTVTTDAAGSFSTPLVIFPHTFPGPRQLRATTTVTAGLLTPVTVTVSIPFLVVPGTLQPPDFAVRN